MIYTIKLHKKDGEWRYKDKVVNDGDKIMIDDGEITIKEMRKKRGLVEIIKQLIKKL